MGTYGAGLYGSALYGAEAEPPPPDPPDPLEELVAVTVEMAFGISPSVAPAPEDWTDITAYVDLGPTGPAITAATGRDSVRAGITPGALSFTLVNTDDRWNPRNTTGPYYGLLDNGTHVRVRVSHDGTTWTAWTGFVANGWPQTITTRYPTVTITAHDVFGLAAQGEAPATAFDAEVASLAVPPDQWWQPGVDGWIDQAGGLVGQHTSMLVELDPVVDGEERSFGQIEPDGYGLVAHPDALLDPDSSNTIVVSAWIRLPDADSLALMVADSGGTDLPLVFQSAPSNTPGVDSASLTVTVGSAGVKVRVACPSWKTEGDGYVTVTTDLSPAGVGFTPNSRHHVQVAVTRPSTSGWVCTPDISATIDGSGGTPLAAGGRIRVWINGTEATGYGLVNLASTALGSAGPLRIGGSSAYYGVTTAPRYVGTIDHLMVWHAHPGSAADLDAQALALTRAGVLAWAGDRLDQRLARIADGMGLTAHVGTLDASGIVTQQGYRRSNPIELLQTIEHTEQGRVWADHDGAIRFSRRSWSWNDPEATTVQVTFSDDPALLAAGAAQELLEAGTVIADDPLDIVNVASVNSTNGRQQVVEDADSIARYGRRNAVQLSNLLHPSDRQSRSIAEWIIDSQGTPKVKAQKVTFRVEDNIDALAPLAAEIEEGWLVRIVTTAGLDLYAHVVGARHEWSYTGWTVTLALDSTRTGRTFFQWGTSSWGGSAGWAF